HSDGPPLAPTGRSATRTCSVRSGAIRSTSARVTTSTPARSARGSCTRFVPCFAWLGQPRLQRLEPRQPLTLTGNCSTRYPAFRPPSTNSRLLSLINESSSSCTLFCSAYFAERRVRSACSSPGTPQARMTRRGAVSEVPVYTTVEPPYADANASVIVLSLVRIAPPSWYYASPISC